MRLFDIDRSAAIAWSVLQQQPSLIATGTVAGTLGIDFDTSAHLEIFSVDLSKKTTTCLGKTSANDRFNKLVWGLTGTQSGAHPKGILAGGLANGHVTLWDPEKIIS
jgi:protein transport protein SEC31